MLFKNFRQRRRIKAGRCPQCNADRIFARIFDGVVWNTASICPQLHFALVFLLDYQNEGLGISYRMLDDCRVIPEEHIKWQEEEEVSAEQPNYAIDPEQWWWESWVEEPEEDSPAVLCSICKNLAAEETAHLHQGEWIGDECCWDEKLRGSE